MNCALTYSQMILLIAVILSIVLFLNHRRKLKRKQTNRKPHSESSSQSSIPSDILQITPSVHTIDDASLQQKTRVNIKSSLPNIISSPSSQISTLSSSAQSSCQIHSNEPEGIVPSTSTFRVYSPSRKKYATIGQKVLTDTDLEMKKSVRFLTPCYSSTEIRDESISHPKRSSRHVSNISGK